MVFYSIKFLTSCSSSGKGPIRRIRQRVFLLRVDATVWLVEGAVHATGTVSSCRAIESWTRVSESIVALSARRIVSCQALLFVFLFFACFEEWLDFRSVVDLFQH